MTSYRDLVLALHEECFLDSSHPRTRDGVGRALVRTLSLVADSDNPAAVATELLDEWNLLIPPHDSRRQ